jgi:F0F1-type ATP synthase membrane subunit b/b'
MNLFKKQNKNADQEAADAQNIIRKANYRALQILEGSNIFSKGLRKDMKQSVDKLSHTLLDTYKQTIEEEKARNIKTIEDVSGQVRQELVKEIYDFKEALHKETLGSQELVESKLNSEYEKVKRELALYKENEIKKIDAKIYEIVVKAVRESVGKTLDVQDHQEIILKCLEDSKKEGLY